MNKIITRIVLSVIVILAVALPTKADTYSINREDLPKAAQEFVSKHFGKTRVSMIKTDKHLLKKTDYDVKLVNGTKIEFNNAGEWTSVDCKTREVPSAIIPNKIKTYVKKNFPETIIVSIEKNTTNYEIELNDGIEIKFDRLGNFKSIDMD